MTQKKCRTILIPDNPSEKDEFGSHQRVADAIFDLILCEESGGKTIGLEGGWGSGKSTVINLLKSKFSHEAYAQNNLVILFDAWAHRDDPLRRTFLETIIIQAEEKEWIDKICWDRVREVIAQRLKIENKTTHSILKPWARWLIVSTLFLPIGVALLNSGLDNPLGFWGLTTLITGLILTLLPIVILVCALVSNHKKKKTSSPEINDGSGNDEPLAFLFQKSTTDTRTETFQTVNPTSIEFEKTFNDLVKEALADSTRRIVLVLDNLDRIDSAEALSLLSTLQTFFQYSTSCPDWLKRVWAIIPYDRNALEKLWNENKTSITTTNNSKDPKIGLDSSANGPNLALSFLDKRFQIRFEVPPILLSGWSEYLINTLLSKAFPDHDKSDFYITYRVFANYRPTPDRLPTPRELILYVNQIGSLHRQWQDTFPLAHYGYYVLRKRAGDDLIDNLKKNIYKDPKLQALLGEKLPDNIAALTFNVEVEQAYQLVIREPIELALGSGEASKIKEWAAFPGFSQVLDSIPFSERVEKEAIWLCNASLVLNDSKVLDAIDAHLKNSIIGELQRAVAKSNSWAPFDLHMASGLSALLLLIRADTSLVIRTLDMISTSPIEESTENQNAALYSWLDGAIYLLELFQPMFDVEDISRLKLAVPTSSAKYIEGCAYLFETENAKPFFNFFKPTAKGDEIASAFGEIVKKDEIQGRHIGAVKIINLQKIGVSWEVLLSEIKAKLASTANIAPAILTAEMSILWELRNHDDQVDILLKELGQQGFILHHLSTNKNEPQAAAYCMMSFLHAFPDFRNVTQQGNSENGRVFVNQVFSSPDNHNELTSHIVELISLYGEYNLPFGILDLPSAKEWAFRILRAIVSRQDASSFFTVSHVLEKWELILEALDCKEFDALMDKLLSVSDFLPHILENQFNPNNARLYASLVRAGGSKNEAFSGWCIQGIKQIEKDELQTHINQEDGITELIIDLAENEIKFDMGPIYQDILVTHGESVMDEKIKVEYCANCWDSLFLALPEHSRDTLRTRLFDSAKGRNGVISPHFFDIYGKELSLAKGVEKTSGIVLGMFTPLVKVRNARGIKWILEFLSSHPTFFSRYSPSTEVADLKDRIQESVSNDQPDDASESLLLLLQIVEKVKLRKKTTDTNTSEEKRVPNS